MWESWVTSGFLACTTGWGCGKVPVWLEAGEVSVVWLSLKWHEGAHVEAGTKPWAGLECEALCFVVPTPAGAGGLCGQGVRRVAGCWCRGTHRQGLTNTWAAPSHARP